MRKKPPRYDLPNAAPDPLRLVQLFLNTSNHETGRELLSDPAALARWFSDQGLPVRSATAADLRRARDARDALRRFATHADDGAALANAARRAKFTVSLDAASLVSQAPGADGAVGAIIAIVYDALRDDSWGRLKTCRNCGWAYWDKSKNRSAAWCSMKLCGSRAKVRRYRSRQRSVTGSDPATEVQRRPRL